MHEHNRRSAMAIALDVHRPWTNGDAKKIGVDGGTPVRFGCTGLGAGRFLFGFRATVAAASYFYGTLQTSEPDGTEPQDRGQARQRGRFVEILEKDLLHRIGG